MQCLITVSLDLSHFYWQKHFKIIYKVLCNIIYELIKMCSCLNQFCSSHDFKECLANFLSAESK